MINFNEAVLPLEHWIDVSMEFITTNFRPVFQAIKVPIEAFLNAVESMFLWAPPLLVIALFAAFAWYRGGRNLGIFTAVSLLFMGLVGVWDMAMLTLAMVLSSVTICTIIGIPLGILAAKSLTFEKILRPILDIMQTTPAFVYLIPVVMLFSIGNVAGVLATIIFSLPPMIRLTTLGIRHVDKEVIEAALAFGATPMQLLYKVQLPLAKPSIFAGLNQTIMMALSMVVIATLIGAGGLGENVSKGLNTLQIGLAAVSGLAIVLMAMMLDRITQSFQK